MMKDAFVIQTLTGTPAGSAENPWNPPIPFEKFSDPNLCAPFPNSPYAASVQPEPADVSSTSIDMASASNCNDTPDKGTDLAYGPRFMGKEGGY